VLDAVLPRRCLVCRRGVTAQEPGVICGGCWNGIIRIDGPRCPSCGVPFRSDAALSHSPSHRCGLCREDPPAFTMAISAGVYEGVLADAIRRLKYHKQVRLARALSALLDPVLDLVPPADAVLAVPLHPARLREREFNQALHLAAWVSRRLQRPLLPDSLRRIRETTPQTTLDRKHRLKNVRRAFAVRNPHAVAGLRMILVDDVYTTGATVNECADVLRAAGAGAVYVVTLARMV